MKRIVLLLFAAIASVAAAPFAGAADPLPRLRANVTVTSEIVTIGDLFADAGKYADIAIFRAPDMGRSGTVSAAEIVRAVETAGMAQYDRLGLEMVTVTRAGREIAAEEITDLLRTALAAALSTEPDRIDIGFDSPPRPLYIAPNTEVLVARLTRSTSGDRFDAVIEAGETDILRVSGTAVATIDIVAATRPLDRGEIVTAADLTVTRMAARQTVAGSATSPADLIGLAARRALRPGVPLSTSDFAAPNLVNRGEIVTIVFRRAGLLLTTRGKALENGAKNAAIPVVNLSSNRVLTAIVTDRGAVEVAAGAAGTEKLAMRKAQ